MLLNTWLRYLVLAGLFILPILPLLVSSSLLFPFITGKGFFFRLVVEVIFAAWLLLALRAPEYRPRRHPLLLALLAFGIILVLATILGVNPAKSFWSNFERMEGLNLYLHLGAYFLVLISTLKSRQLWRNFFITSLGVSVIVSIHALAQLAGWTDIHQGGVRVDANLGNATYLAIYLVFHLFLAAWLWVTSEKKPRYLAIGLGILGLVQLFLLYHTATRGAVLGLMIGATLAALVIAFKASGRVRRVALVVPLAFIILAAGFYAVRNTNFVQNSLVLERFAGISLSEGTVQSRFLIWQMSLQGFKERPLLGWGPENYNLVFNKYYNPAMWPQEPWFDRSHNVFFDWLINAGLVGLLGYLSIFILAIFSLFKLAIKRSDQVMPAAILAGLLAAYFVHNFFVFDNLVSYFLFLTVIGYIIFWSQEESYVQSKIGSWQAGSTGTAVAGALLVIGLGLSLYYFNYQPMATGRAIIAGLSPLPAGLTPAQGVAVRGNYFRRAISGSYLGRAEATEQLSQVAYSIAGESTISPADKNTFLQFTLNHLEEAAAASPLDARAYLFWGNYLAAFGNYQAALSPLRRAAELSPQKQDIAFTLAWSEISAGEAERGIARLKAAVAGAPEYFRATEAYARALKEVGRRAEGAAAIREYIAAYPERAAEAKQVLLDF